VIANYPLQYLQNGANLLKHGRQGKPHIRFFYITDDATKIVWKENESQRGGAKFIELANVQRCILGQVMISTIISCLFD